jgi:hypothetical protein
VRPFINLLGKKFGRLVILSRAKGKEKRGVYWLCKCDCGNKKVIKGTSLTRKKIPTRSCGCIVKEGNNKLSFGEAQFNFLYRVYKKNAKERGLLFNLDKNLFRKIITSNCYYCGSEPVHVCYRLDLNGGFSYNGIDRVNNNLGYILSNIVPCCENCNKAKRDLTLSSFMNWINRLVNYQIKVSK